MPQKIAVTEAAVFVLEGPHLVLGNAQLIGRNHYD